VLDTLAKLQESGDRIETILGCFSGTLGFLMTALEDGQKFSDAVREALRLAQQEVAQAQERFRAGVAGNADVITASLSLNSARTQAVDALSSYQGAKVALARAVGSVTALP